MQLFFLIAAALGCLVIIPLDSKLEVSLVVRAERTSFFIFLFNLGLTTRFMPFIKASLGNYDNNFNLI